jgi:hypothetical protein
MKQAIEHQQLDLLALTEDANRVKRNPTSRAEITNLLRSLLIQCVCPAANVNDENIEGAANE